MNRTFRSVFGLLALVPSVLSAQDMNMGGTESQTKFGGFADVGYRSFRPSGKAGFDFGGFDLFITSKLSQKVNFLVETVFERGGDGVMGVDVERLSIAYNYRPYARFAAGRFHSPLGYWNSAFHHGAIMAPVIDRPFIAEFEDGNGLLPMHNLGAMVSGRDISPLHLGYDVAIGSQLGIGGALTGNPTTGVTLALNAEPVSGFKIGTSLYKDTRLKGIETQTGGTLAADVDQLITGAFAAINKGKLELIGEVHNIAQKSATTSTVNSWGGYAYAGIRSGTVVPYVMYEAAQAKDGDLFYDAMSLHNAAVGVRKELTANTVIKFEMKSIRLPNKTNRGEFSTQFALQF